MKVSSCHKVKLIPHSINKRKVCSKCGYYCNFIEFKQIKTKKPKIPLSLM